MASGDEPNLVVAEPTTWTGSIGVIIPHYDISGLLERWDIRDDSIVSHPYKDLGSMTREMTPEEREILRGLVTQSFNRFTNLVHQGRPKLLETFTQGLQQELDEVEQSIDQLEKKPNDATDEAAKAELEEETQKLSKRRDELKRKLEDPEAALPDTLFTGQVFTADAAKRYGLVDEIGYLEEAVQRSMDLAGVTEEDCEVIKYEREPGLAELLLGVESAQGRPDLGMLLDGAAPRAYYLYTSLPPLLSTAKRSTGR
jgi:protease-4